MPEGEARAPVGADPPRSHLLGPPARSAFHRTRPRERVLAAVALVAIRLPFDHSLVQASTGWRTEQAETRP
jgi:hypothetical protein